MVMVKITLFIVYKHNYNGGKTVVKVVWDCCSRLVYRNCIMIIDFLDAKNLLCRVMFMPDYRLDFLIF